MSDINEEPKIVSIERLISETVLIKGSEQLRIQREAKFDRQRPFFNKAIEYLTSTLNATNGAATSINSGQFLKILKERV